VLSTLKDVFSGAGARSRQPADIDLAQARRAVADNGNKSELAVGYCTLSGDMG